MAGTATREAEQTVEVVETSRVRRARPVAVRVLAASGIVAASLVIAGPAWAGPIMGC